MTVIPMSAAPAPTSTATYERAVGRNLLLALRDTAMGPRQLTELLGSHPGGPLRGFAEMYVDRNFTDLTGDPASRERAIAALHQNLRTSIENVALGATVGGTLRNAGNAPGQAIAATKAQLGLATDQSRAPDGRTQPIEKAFRGVPRLTGIDASAEPAEKPRTGSAVADGRGREPLQPN